MHFPQNFRRDPRHCRDRDPTVLHLNSSCPATRETVPPNTLPCPLHSSTLFQFSTCIRSLACQYLFLIILASCQEAYLKSARASIPTTGPPPRFVPPPRLIHAIQPPQTNQDRRNEFKLPFEVTWALGPLRRPKQKQLRWRARKPFSGQVDAGFQARKETPG